MERVGHPETGRVSSVHSALSRLSPSWLTSARRRRRGEDTVDSVPCLGSGADKGGIRPTHLAMEQLRGNPGQRSAIQERLSANGGRKAERRQRQGDRHRERWRTETRKRKYAEMRSMGTEMQRQRYSETKEKLETNSDRETDKDRRMRRASDGHEGAPHFHLRLALCPELITSLDSPGMQSMCWGLWSMAEARETTSWNHRVHRLWGSLRPAAQVEGVLATTVPVLRLLQEVRQAWGSSGKLGSPDPPRGLTARKDDVGCWVFDAYV